MVKCQKWLFLGFLFLAILPLSRVVFGIYSQNKTESNPVVVETFNKQDWFEVGISQYQTNHQQEVWISILEWCESEGRGVEAINPKDKDGTPSYYHFQWKPSTFKYYALKYELLPNDLEYEDYFNWMSDYDLQREIVRRMIGDSDVVWKQEFPVCSKRLRLPPKAEH